MGHIILPNILAKIGLSPNKPRLNVGAAAAQSLLPQLITLIPVSASTAVPLEIGTFEKHPSEPSPSRWIPFHKFRDLISHHHVGAAAILFLVIAAAAIEADAAYRSAHITFPLASKVSAHGHVAPLRGPNIAIAADQLPSTLERITSQPIDLTIGAKTVAVDSPTIKSWLQIVTDKSKKTSYIHVNEKAIGTSLGEITGKFAKDPVNQVSTTYTDGRTVVIATGRDGVSIGNTADLAKQIAPNVLGAKGTQLNVPLQPVPFQAVTTAAFDKLIEVNIVTKQMYLYDKGQFTRQYPISAGAPATPTPIGQYKIYSKLPVQDMKGLNPDGSKYFQPNVHWINYFLPGGYAVHGNYWRPSDWFGAINSSHGCVSLPDSEAQWVYNWAPIGTTVITHT